jgi:hypothetical protein
VELYILLKIGEKFLALGVRAVAEGVGDQKNNLGKLHITPTNNLV